MRRVIFTAAAIVDLQDILRYVTIEKGERAIGRRLVDDLKRKCLHLAGLTGRVGRPRPELADGARSFPYQGYLLIYSHGPEDLFRVIAVIHASRDLPAVFDERQ